ncbi:hypothetical protein OSB04_026547 [Centaurea solstitialis]|uniref:Uncharacterized protein n=1 Tax=Centaurea solstitialis TaxID=347529 RepID=A0AA38SP57_9ASTR|nr:hypothetical protein OSB04_026547 [Centaurea solstitialis]
MAKKFYVCGNSSHSYVTDDPSTICPSCHFRLNKELSYVAGSGAKRLTTEGGGFVKPLVAYMITDDLECGVDVAKGII